MLGPRANFSIITLVLNRHTHRIDWLSVSSHLEMKNGTTGNTSRAYLANGDPEHNAIARAHVEGGKMGVDRLPTRAMIDEYGISKLT